jgi:hypothetical protein
VKKKNHVNPWLIVLALTACPLPLAHGGDPHDGPVDRPHFLARLGPRGGWNPDGRGIYHWWNRHCYPRSCAPDDYCRKPMPELCRRFAAAPAVQPPQNTIRAHLP